VQFKEKIRDIPYLWKISKWVLLFFIVFTFVGFLILPPVIELLLEKKLSEQLNREVQ
jgi:hypothetical protein